MWAVFASAVRGSWLSILGYAGLAAGAAAVILGIRKSGEDKIQSQDLQKTIAEVKINEQVQTSIDGLSDAEREQLHDKWTR